MRRDLRVSVPPKAETASRAKGGNAREAWYVPPVTPAQPKRLHEMNRLGDMGRFPVVIYVGATANVLASIAVFYWLHGHARGSFPVAFGVTATLLALNLAPVVALRWREGTARLADTPPIAQMRFVQDQHRFATWVYAVASGNLFFWLMLAWAAFDLEHSTRAWLAVETLAFVCTFAPVWVRLVKTRPTER